MLLPEQDNLSLVAGFELELLVTKLLEFVLVELALAGELLRFGSVDGLDLLGVVRDQSLLLMLERLLDILFLLLKLLLVGLFIQTKLLYLSTQLADLQVLRCELVI